MIAAISPRLYIDLIGKPFAAGGRGPSAYDCVGLTVLLQRRLGHDLPDYASTPDEQARQYSMDGGMLGPCRRVERPQPGCVVLMHGMDAECHLGTMTDRFRMIHASVLSRSVVQEVLSRSIWGARVMGFYAPEPHT